jgi:hypothetical protein
MSMRVLGLMAVLLGALGAAVAAAAVAGSELIELARGSDAPAEQDTGAAAAEGIIAQVGHTAGDVLAVVRTALLLVLIWGLALLAIRLAARAARRYERLTLVPYRADQAEPEEIRRLFEAWHQLLLERWWRRLVLGQRGMALEVVTQLDAGGQFAGTLSLVCPSSLRRSFEGALLGCYPDSRLVRGTAPPPLRRVVRLKKRSHFVRALRPFELEGRNLMDSTLSQMAALREPSVVQYALTPTPSLFDRYSRRRFTAVERDSMNEFWDDPRRPGQRSQVLARELEGGLRVQHRPLFFTDIRVAATGRAACDAVAGTLRGESAGENRLVVRCMHAAGRRALYLRRLVAGVGNPIPGWRRGVLASSELATLWHLPSPALKGARVTRSPIPRAAAASEISRDPRHALMRDEEGLVGILPQDKSDGLGLIGGQKTGKTSVLCRTVMADALDRDCAVVVLMPKPGDALKALSMVPKDRTVHYLDLEKPEFGINPLLAGSDPAMVADKVVEAFRDVNAEGDIRGSSDRYLRQAAQAAIGATRAGALEGQPTLWHMYRILMPGEVSFRDKVVQALYPDPRYAETATFFGRELPGDLRDATAQTVAKLDAPRNKILRLLVQSLDMVLRHPLQLSLDELVRRREVLIVDGKMSTFGSDNCRVMMQFILNGLYGALQRQQQLPERERVRVALKVDEAHLVLNESFADAMATLRSGGLEVVAAWQYGEQIQDPKIRAGMLSLLRQRCMFSMGESADAREMSSVAMDVYADAIHADPESQARLRLAPDTIFNLPNTYALCSWIAGGARQPAFLARTIPLETHDEIVLHHLEAQRARGCQVPERMPDPMPDPDWRPPRELPTAAIDRDRTAPTNGARPARRSAAVPDTYTELDLDGVRGIQWDDVTPAEAEHEPTYRELEILAALWSHGFLFSTQIWRRWWSGTSLRSAQQGLNRMTKAGWVRRFSFLLAERGAQQRVYCLTRAGFELLEGRTGRNGPYLDPEAKWREPDVTDARRVLRDLHANGWALAFMRRCGRVAAGWRGARDSRLAPPRRRARGHAVELTPETLELEGGRRLRGFAGATFEPVHPDAAVELRLTVGDKPLRFDVLIELDRSRDAAAAEDRLRRYDGLVSGWAGLLPRYRKFGTPPALVLVCEDEPARNRLLKIADRVVCARLAKAGTPEAEWPAPGRRAMFFVLERDIHEGSLAAVQLAEHPPGLPRRVSIVDPSLLPVD